MRTLGFNRLIERLYPPTCLLCGAPGEGGRDLCAGCRSELPWNLNACARCALPFDVAVPAGTLCGACQKKPPAFDRCVTAFRYEQAVPALVVGAKFRGQLNAARLLGECLAVRIHEATGAAGGGRPDVLIPVPLHRRRLRQRGYNQAFEIARSLGRALNLPVDAGCCARLMATPPQAGLDERARRRNIRGAFAVTASLAGVSVAVVDDVVTTGSTVNELSRILAAAGAARVEVWAVARTP
ncbi:ComF family protein [Thiocystis violacea]|uniref:ComF family protein n=1 Tax=Thiocystis violacea TaxID=13725 RepID=UPI001902FC45|nr:ComF family protein [Thiocystis violacea]MBK1723726.1 phosphoribosyltransferase [Thiocystis violacea]